MLQLDLEKVEKGSFHAKLAETPHALSLRVLFIVCQCIAQLSKLTNSKFELPSPNSFSVKIIFVTQGSARC